ncbi:MAG: transcriptional regulator, partial [Nonlabens sp.]
MRKIQMVDLQGQYEGIKDRVNNGLKEVIESAAFINGPEAHAF